MEADLPQVHQEPEQLDSDAFQPPATTWCALCVIYTQPAQRYLILRVSLFSSRHIIPWAVSWSDHLPAREALVFVFGPAGVGFAQRGRVRLSASPVAQRVHRGRLLLLLPRDGNVARARKKKQKR